MLRRLVLVVVALSLVGLSHWYVILRTALSPGLTTPWPSILGSAVVLGGIASLCKLFVGPRLNPVVAWTGGIWMGLLWLSLWMFGLSELVMLALGAFVEVDPAMIGFRNGVVTGLVVSTGLICLVQTLGGPEIRNVEITLARWPKSLDGYTVVQLSDIHFGQLLRRKFAQRITDQTNALNPDLVAITGDLADGSAAELKEVVAPLSELRAKDGVFFVTGNHDHYSGADGWRKHLSTLGMTVLHNTHHPLEGFDVVGVRDRSFGQATDVADAVEGRDDTRPALLLAHDPLTFERAVETNIDLTLSGHTHAGQIWPWVFFVRILYRHIHGVYTEGSSKLYVSRGTGFWGPPMRLFAPAEITAIRIRSGESTRPAEAA